MRAFKTALTALVVASLLAPLAPAAAEGRAPLRITVNTIGTAIGNSNTAGTCDAPNYRDGAGVVQAVTNAVAGDTIVLCGTGTFTLPVSLSVTQPLNFEGVGSASALPTLAIATGRVLNLNLTGKVTIATLAIDGGAVAAGQPGAAIRLQAGDLDIRDSRLFAGTATEQGAALAVVNPSAASTVSVFSTTFDGNTATGNGGAIYFYSPTGALSVINSTFSGNTAAAGAAIYNEAGTVTVDFSTALNNTAVGGSFRKVSVSNSILANYGASPACGTDVVSTGGNLATDVSCAWAGALPPAAGGSSLATFAQLKLGHLSSRPGEAQGVPLIRPANGSVALDFIATSPVTLDAVGRNRPQSAGGKWDAGAYERRAGLKEWKVDRRLTYSSYFIHWPTMASKTIRPKTTMLFSPSAAGARYSSLAATVCTVAEFTGVITFTAPGACLVESYLPLATAGGNLYQEYVEVVTVTATTFTAPSTPLGVTVTPGDKQFKVTWTSPASNGGAPILAYDVIADPELPGAASTTIKSCSSPCTVKGDPKNPTLSRPLVNNANYVIRIRVSNKAGQVATYAVSSVVRPLAPVLPSKPTYVLVTPGKGNATIRWANPDEPGRTPIKNYEVRAFLKSTPKKVLKSAKVNGVTYKYLMTGLPKGKAVIFKVFAINSGGTSPASNAVTVTIKK